MALDVLTIVASKAAENVAGKLLDQSYKVTLSNSYVTGGYTFPINANSRYGQIGIHTVEGVIQQGTNTAGIGYTAVWDKQAGKLAIFTGGSQVSGNTDLSTIIVYLNLKGTR